jgi:AraC-like DNA-binding protein/mannose-6-phosphate isomerase-like protein (cupin superfamily)
LIDVDLSEYEGVPRPLVATGNDYPASHELDWHRHRRGQLLYAAKGAVVVRTPQGAWVAPPERAVWIPSGVPHSVKMVGAVSMRSVLIEPEVWSSVGDRCLVVGACALLRSLLVAAAAIEPEYQVAGRDGMVMELLVAELARAPLVPLAVPFPAGPALAAKCHAFLEHPTPHASIDEWSAELGLGRRAFTRAFRRETGMSFAQWRRQACLLVAIPRLGAGEPVTAVALDLGYESPAAFATMFKSVLGVAPSRYHS